MNISESDLPVRPIETFEAHLASRMGRNFVAYSKVNMVTFHDGQGLSKVGTVVTVVNPALQRKSHLCIPFQGIFVSKFLYFVSAVRLPRYNF
jgi:hypothetical protein